MASRNAIKDRRHNPAEKGSSNKSLGIMSKQLGTTYNVKDKLSEEVAPNVSGGKGGEKKGEFREEQEKQRKVQQKGDEKSINMDTFTVDKMSDMKAKVLEKVSSKVIWRKKSANNKDTGETVAGSDGAQNDKKLTAVVKEDVTCELSVEANKAGKKDNVKTIKGRELLAEKGNVKPSRELYKETRKESPKQTNRINPELIPSSPKSSSGLSAEHDRNSVFKYCNSYSSNSSSQFSQSGVHSRQKDINPSPARVKCDPSVYMWLRRLALLEEEKYIDMFARNEIDLSVLVTLDEKQLEKMGVLALGAMKKLLAGIEELKIQEEKRKAQSETSSAKSSPNTKKTDPLLRISATDMSVKSKNELQSPKTPNDSKVKNPTSFSTASSTSGEKFKDSVSVKTTVKRSSSMSQTFTKVEPRANSSSEHQKSEPQRNEPQKSEPQRSSQRQDKQNKARPREGSLTRTKPSKGVLLIDRPQSGKGKGRKQKPEPSLPRAKSADVRNKRATELVNKKAEEGKNEKIR